MANWEYLSAEEEFYWIWRNLKQRETENDEDGANLMVQHLKHINFQNKDRRTYVWSACCQGYPKTVEILVKHGADVNIPDDQGETALGIAARNGHTEIVRMLLKKCAVDTPDNEGRTLVFITAKEGHTETVKMLVEHGANVNIPNDDGETPLGIAARCGHTEIVRMLLEDCHAIPHNSDFHGRTPLFAAANAGHEEIVCMLLKGWVSDTIRHFPDE
jgi:ankyrin repeat protein